MASIKHSLVMVVVVSLLLQHGRGAPSVFLVHPLLITTDAQLAIQGHPRLFLANAGDGSVVDQQSQVTQVEDYDEGIEESRDWKEDDESANETGTNNQAQESNDYTEKSEQGSEMEDNKDDSDDGSYHENNETEEKTEGVSDSDDGSYHGNDETEEKTEEKLEDASDSDDGSYHEKDESADEVEDQKKDESGNEADDGLYHENVESDEKTEVQETYGDASDSDDGSYHENDESGNKADQEKYDSDDGSYQESDEGQSTQDSHDKQNESKNVSENRQGRAEKIEGKIEGVAIGINHKEQTNPESKRDTPKVNEEKEIKSNVDKSPVDEEGGEDNKAAKPLHVPEEIVIGSIDKAQVEVSKSQNIPVPAKGSDVKDSSAAVKLNPPLKETEEVQLAPVVYHVSPKLHQDAEPPATAA